MSENENRARDFSRRHFLKGTAAGAVAVSLGTASSAAWMAPAAAEELPPIPPHGAELRGMDLVVKSPTTEGRFGFMFKSQPPHPASGTMLEDLGLIMEEQPVTGGAVTTADNDRFNENPNPALTSGFTFVGQFVDHDITFDTTPLSDQQADPDATTNFRTPRYDLDAIYGLGPNQNPKLYDPNDRDKFKIVETTYDETNGIKGLVLAEPDVVYYPKPPLVVRDVQRDGGKAIIADPRNDQQLIVLQMHVAMQMFHNKLVDRMRALGFSPAGVFENARRMARWHYQWMVIHEFLPAIVGKATADAVYKEVENKAPIINLKYYRPRNRTGRPFIPVEFAVAAYRFGHSITRPRYTVQDVVTTLGTRAVSSVPLFEAVAGDNNLNGSRAVPPRLKIQWSKFFNDPLAKPLTADGPVPRTARPVRQFDASLAGPLFRLPSTVQPDTSSSSLLAQRNLLRGRKMGLPSGQQVARLMGVTPLTNDQLSYNHRIRVTIPIPTSGTGANVVNVEDEFDEANANLKATLDKPEFAGEAPLWFYILKEAEIVGKGRELGPVGGRIVAEVLVGLLQKDPNSYLYLQPNWKPQLPIARVKGTFTMADLLMYAGVWS
jgi:Animal haem peroxidase/TAT (twin-arginine translocation) pathway signal sequence